MDMNATKWSNQRKTRRNAYPGRPPTPLTRRQKMELCVAARAAHRRMGGGAPADVWRRAEAVKAAGCRVSEATQNEYLRLLAHFQDLAGDSGRALETELRSAEEPRRVALRKLRLECAARGLSMGYPEAICRRQYKCGLDEAAPNQLWRLVFTVRNRRKKAAKKEAVK